MFFPEKIRSVRPGDRVLEIGPGSNPHPRSDVFLELAFDAEQARLEQRGGTPDEPDFGGKPVVYYDGTAFPFADAEFDYVICSHVIEHVENPQSFVKEINRVSGGRGYIEYPLITYEYLYSFDVHLNFVKFDESRNVLRYIPKRDTGLAEFSAVCAFFNATLAHGWDDLTAANKKLFFEGFEFVRPFEVERMDGIETLVPPPALIERKKPLRWFIVACLNKLRL